ncbi:MAG: type II toxin-antitoxin system PemK/MazF family toxin [Kiritimatiellae bacterium]|nr:type II toxin-antitoxin system PemK/MazF family toxin [Kiritimatiellia bacterium]
MTPCSRWDIVLVPFPFTDLTTSKKRPALVVSPDSYNSGPDVVIAFITSRLNTPQRPGDHLITDWQASGLPKPSQLRMKLATISRSIVIKKLGHLTPAEEGRVQAVLRSFFELDDDETEDKASPLSTDQATLKGKAPRDEAGRHDDILYGDTE